ncbi:Adenosine 5'-monophosphoramidase [Coemansia sp. RSA 1646]|nr:Adenosine 5'-monophosphoramidase [Coemansia sp. RSA 1646]
MFARMDDNNRNIGQGGADQGQGAGARQARRMHTVRPEHVQTIQAMFPDIPEAAIRADLARTGSPAVTSDNILRNGGTLPLPPATRAEQSAGAAAAASGHAHIGATNSGGQNAGTIGSATASGIALNTSHSPLVNRLRISKDADAGELPLAPPKIWETDPNRRADVLRKRKEFMGEIPSVKLMETASSFAFLDIGPLSDGHALVIPKYHAEKMHELPDEFLADSMPVAKKIAQALNMDDYNILQNNGRIAHQEVPHVHFHVIPKPNAEEGLSMTWPAKKADVDKLKELASKLKL